MSRIPGLALATTAPAVLGLLALLLAGCDAIYDDTKGWANRLEASILETAHEMGEPEPAGEAEAAPEPAPPAVPVEPVETASLAARPPLTGPAMPMTADPGVMAERRLATPPAKPEGTLARAAGELLAEAKPAEAPKEAGENAKAAPPRPLPKPAETPGGMAKSTDDPALAVVVHLSSLRSEEAAKREWSDLQRAFPEPLAGVAAEFRRTELGDKGTFYRVLAGPLPSRDRARALCTEVKAKDAKQYCRILPSQPKAS